MIYRYEERGRRNFNLCNHNKWRSGTFLVSGTTSFRKYRVTYWVMKDKKGRVTKGITLEGFNLGTHSYCALPTMIRDLMKYRNNICSPTPTNNRFRLNGFIRSFILDMTHLVRVTKEVWKYLDVVQDLEADVTFAWEREWFVWK